MFIKLIIVIFILLSFIKNINAISCSISENEYNALYNFYTSTNGIYWKNENNKWIFPNPYSYNDLSLPCSTGWYGLTCITNPTSPSYYCPTYSVTNTNNAQKNYDTCGVYACPGSQIIISGCGGSGSCNGDQYIRLFDSSNNQVASNDDFCGPCSQIIYTVPSFERCQNYSIHEGCYGATSCNGRLVITVSNVLCNIAEIELPANNLQGSLTKSIATFQNLTNLYLYSNQLLGTIPSELGNLVQLRYLVIYSNRFSGTIPSELENLVQLYSLLVSNNQLSGSIPSELGNLINLNYFDFDNNTLSGSIPSELGNLVRLSYLFLFSNQLIGAIPSELGYLTKLAQLKFFNNQLSGSIPSELGNLAQLNILYLYNNQLIGSIPSELGNLIKLNYLSLSINQLIGTIPSELGNLVQLYYFYFDNNQLIGTIPSELGSLSSLQFLDFSNNSLTGSIPKSFNQLNKLKSLFLTNNSLSGNLDGIFNSYAQSNLINIDLVNNILSGSIPSYIFGISSLQTFAVSNNCIKGSLPKEICLSISLNSLILDGLHTKCGTRIFPSYLPINTFYDTSDVIIGGIPICVFNMVELTTLHVSGNRIIAKLDNEMVLSNKLTNIDLSTNLFTGKIPHAIQNKQWVYLNLGFNKFKDTIIDTFPIQSNSSNTLSLTLVNNRISGLIPSSLNTYSNISVLDGNIFSCSSIFSSLNIFPKHDPLSSLHQCGTNYFYQLILLFCIITIIVVLIELRYYKDNDNIFQNVWYKNIDRLRSIGKEVQTLLFFRPSSLSFANNHDDNDEYNDILRITDGLSYEKDSNITLLLIVSENLQQCLIYFIIFLCFWCLSCIILHQYYSTYDFMYGYNLSMIFLSGYTSANVIILLMIISIIFIYFIINNLCLQSIVNIVDAEDDDKKIEKVVDIKKSKSNYFLMFSIAIIINLIALFAVNGLYVFASLYPEKYSHNEVYAILLSIFNTVWKSSIIPLILSVLITHESDKDIVDNKIKSLNKKKYSKFTLIFQCVLAILNDIVIPLITTSFLSTNCFHYAVMQQPLISSSYNYNDCILYTNSGKCVKYLVLQKFASYQPPFQYSYQCASTLMTTYSSVYITMCILLIVPSLLVSFITFCFNKIKSYELIEILVNTFISSNLKPLESTSTNNKKIDIFKYPKLCYSILCCKNNNAKLEEDEKEKKEIVNTSSIIFDQTQYIVNIVTFMTLYATVGLMLPIVGIILCMSLYLYIHIVLSSIAGKLTNPTLEDKENLEKECENFVDNLSISKYIYIVMGLFFPLFVFDAVGDEEGLGLAIRYFIFTSLIPCILWLIIYIYTLYSNNAATKSTQKEKNDENVIELKNIRNSEVNNPLTIRIE